VVLILDDKERSPATVLGPDLNGERFWADAQWRKRVAEPAKPRALVFVVAAIEPGDEFVEILRAER